MLQSIPGSAFGKDLLPQDIAALNDGSLMVQTDRYGLYRVANGRTHEVWPANPRCGRNGHFTFAFAGSLETAIAMNVRSGNAVAVRADGSLALRLPSSIESVAQDSDGVVWFTEGRRPNQSIHAYLPQTRRELTLPSPKGIYALFRSPNGHVYASNFEGLFELKSAPDVRARMVHGPIRDAFPIQAVGHDRSLWTSSATEVIHVHTNGEMRVMRFAEPPTQITHPLGAIQLRMAPNGSVWVTAGTPVRIDDHDRITVLTAPAPEERGDIKFAPDSSLWALARDARNGQPQGIVNFAPASGQTPSHWPFTVAKSTASETPFVPCPTPSPPSTPTPPLPPESGRIDFVYVANSRSGNVEGFWVGHHGKLTPVRGSPFAAGNTPETLTIEPMGRYLYTGTSDGIFAYAMDPRTGRLRVVPGSPFEASRGVSSVAISSNGRYAYSANLNAKTVSGYAVDSTTGSLRQLGWSPYPMDWPFRIALNPVRDIAYLLTGYANTIETFDLTRGSFRLVAKMPLNSLGFGSGMLVDHRGRRLYVSHTAGTISMTAIDAQTGMPSLLSTVIFKAGNDPRTMVTDPHGRFLYVTNIPTAGNRVTISGYRIDPRHGALTSLPTSPFADVPGQGGNGIAITPDGAFLYATNFSTQSISGFGIDGTTGAIWPVTGSPFKAGEIPEDIVSCRRLGSRCKPTE